MSPPTWSRAWVMRASTTTFNGVTVTGNNLIGNTPKAKGVGFVNGATITGLPAGLTDKDDPGGTPVQL